VGQILGIVELVTSRNRISEAPGFGRAKRRSEAEFVIVCPGMPQQQAPGRRLEPEIRKISASRSPGRAF